MATKVVFNALTGNFDLVTDLTAVESDISALQTSVAGKQATITGAATTITSSDLATSVALISNSSGKVAVSTTTDTELSYVHGVTSAIQTQLNAKQATITGAATTITSSNLATSVALVSDVSGKVAASSTTAAEIGYVSGVTSAIQTQLNAKQATGNYITALTSDVTASGPGSATATLATVNSNVGSFGSSTAIPNFTVDGKGRLTAAGSSAVIAPAGTLTGDTLASNVLTSSLTSVGTIATGTWSGTTIALNKGGTGQTTKAAAFDALSPMSASGDMIYGAASGTGTRIPKGADGQILTLNGGVPTWLANSAAATDYLQLGEYRFNSFTNMKAVGAYVSTNARATFRDANGTSGYQVPSGKTLTVHGVTVVGNTSAAMTLQLAYADADIGFDSATAFTTPIYLYGDSSYSIMRNPAINGSGQAVGVPISFAVNFTVPQLKYLSLLQSSGVSAKAYVIVWCVVA